MHANNRPRVWRLLPQRMPVAAVVALLAALVAGVPALSVALQPDDEHRRITLEVVDQLLDDHYSQRPLDDALGAQVLEQYLRTLDPARLYLLRGDISLFRRYERSLDDAFDSADLEPAFSIFERFSERQHSRLQWVLDRLNADYLASLDFAVEEELRLNRDELPWPESTAVADDLWRKRLKNDVLALRLAGRDDEAILKSLRRRYQNQLDRLEQMHADDVVALYLNALALSFDPHTNYLPPRDTENLDIQMSLSLEGIGALLRSDYEFTEVVRLIPGGPAEKDGVLKPADRIVAVGQGKDGEMIDVIGWRLDEVVEMIRGPKGTVVRLETLPAGITDLSATRIVPITRNEVALEEQSAQGEIFEIPRGDGSLRVGVITLPAFYLDFRGKRAGERGYRSTTRDVRRLLREFHAEGIDSLVLDLRNNGGGSLEEANALAGLFIDTGPIVQVRNASERVRVMRDPDPRQIYDGPLVVIVDRLSASASEIVAAAVQDHGRGIVVGAETFGKGTVQALAPIEAGTLKYTMAKFYRISGASTQFRGVTPDIAFPSVYDPEMIGESALDGALPWDTIRPVRYRRAFDIGDLVPVLRADHGQRIKTDPDFRYLTAEVELSRKELGRDALSLQLSTRERERGEAREKRLALENARRLAKGLEPLTEIEEPDPERPPIEDPATADDEPDPYLAESVQIAADLAQQMAGHTMVRR